MTALGKTPWVDRSLRNIHAALAHAVPPEWLPRFDASGKVEEFGCGHYGCVMPTGVEGLICKLTTDVSEAHFVARALELEPTSGIVEYKKILWAPALKHRGRPVFVLWRSEAFSVGKWRYGELKYPPHLVFGEERQQIAKTDPSYHYTYRVQGEADTLLRNFLTWAATARKYLYLKQQAFQRELRATSVWTQDSAGNLVPDDSTYTPRLVAFRQSLLTAAWAAYERMEPVQDTGRSIAYVKGLNRVGIALRTCLYIAQEMQGNPSLYRVGEALQYYLEEGLLLADVHGNNLGLDAEGEVLITDPGHVVEFHPRWATSPQFDTL